MTGDDKIFVITSYYCGDDEECRYFTHDEADAKAKLRELFEEEQKANDKFDEELGTNYKNLSTFSLIAYPMNKKLADNFHGWTIEILS